MPSPTFLLHNTYQGYILRANEHAGICNQPPSQHIITDDDEGLAEVSIHHMDLYRLEANGSGLARLDVQSVCSSGISLIEWASRLPTPPARAIDVAFIVLTNVRHPLCLCSADGKQS